MGKDRINSEVYSRLALRYGVSEEEVRRAVVSFFDIILSESKALPFDSPKKIYSRDKFLEYGSVTAIPCIGRMGPVYSRYLKWRANEAKELGIVSRKSFRKGLSREEIEELASKVLDGGQTSLLNLPDNAVSSNRPRRHHGKYNRVWLVGKSGRRLAWQVIPEGNKQK